MLGLSSGKGSGEGGGEILEEGLLAGSGAGRENSEGGLPYRGKPKEAMRED